MRKLLDRAKGLLQSEHGMTEPQAFRWIQKTSMDRRLTMRKVAEAVIEGTMGATDADRASPGDEPGTASGRRADRRPRSPSSGQGTRQAAAARGPGDPLVPCPPSPG